jgi:hypothetical protein
MSHHQSSLDNWLTPMNGNISQQTTQQHLTTNNNSTNILPRTRPNSTSQRIANHQHKRRQTLIQSNQTTDRSAPTQRLTPPTQTRLGTSTTTLQPLTSNCTHWGDNMAKKLEGTLRFAFRNINSLPVRTPNSRHDELLYDIRKGQFDLFGILETNLCWQHLDRQI